MMFGTMDAASLVAVMLAPGRNLGSIVIAVSTLSVLAGGNRPCGSFAARTWPVLAFAITYAEAGTAGSGGAPLATTIPVDASARPPTSRRSAATGCDLSCLEGRGAREGCDGCEGDDGRLQHLGADFSDGAVESGHGDQALAGVFGKASEQGFDVILGRQHPSILPGFQFISKR